MEPVTASGRSRRRWSLLLGGVLFLWTPAALAAPTAAMKEAARHLMDEGKERTARGDLTRALEAYRSAHELMRVPTTGLAVARTLVALKQIAEAREVAAEVAQLPVESGEPAPFAEARNKAKELERDLSERLPKIQIVLHGGPPKSVLLDDKELPLPLASGAMVVSAGSHVVAATDAAGKQVQERVEVQERETKKVDLTLEDSKTTEPKGPTGPTDPAEPAGPAGDRTGAAKVLMFGGFGLAIVGLGVGTVTGLMTSSKATTVKAQCESNVCAPEAKPDLDSALTMASISTVGFIATGVGVTAGVIGLLLPRKSGDPAAVTSGFNGLTIGAGSVGYRGVF